MSKRNPNGVPDAEAPDLPISAHWSAHSTDSATDEEFWGADASLPPGAYGPTIRSALPDPTLQRRALREIERRFRAIQSPAFPLEFPRRLPGSVFLRGYRSYTLRSRSLCVDDFGRDPAYCRRMQPALDFLYSRWLQVEMQGLSNIPTAGPAILVCNHNSAFAYDAMMLMHGVAQHFDSSKREPAPQIRPLLEDRISQAPYLGVHLRRLGAVRACPDNAERLLREGGHIAVFPEGHRAISKRGSEPMELQRFGRGGFVRLALNTKAPILPVAIVAKPGAAHRILHDASTRILPKALRGIPKWMSTTAPLPPRGSWTISIGEPIDLSAKIAPSDRTARASIAQESAAIRAQITETIKRLFDSAP